MNTTQHCCAICSHEVEGPPPTRCPMCECIWREADAPRSEETALTTYADAHAHEHAETCAKRDLREAALLAVDIEEQAIRLNRVLAALVATK